MSTLLSSAQVAKSATAKPATQESVTIAWSDTNCSQMEPNVCLMFVKETLYSTDSPAHVPLVHTSPTIHVHNVWKTASGVMPTDASNVKTDTLNTINSAYLVWLIAKCALLKQTVKYAMTGSFTKIQAKSAFQ